MLRRPTRLFAAAAAVLAAIVTLAPSASAHVTVNPREAETGGFTKLAFRVPNERDNAGTVKLEINFPPEHPIRSVSVRPHQGWTYRIEKTPLATPITSGEGEPTTEAVSKITWTGGTIRPGEFDEFEVSVGPLPENTGQLVFKALQTYEGGEVVRWIEERTPGGGEPEHPAPVLTLINAQQEDRAATATEGGGATSAQADLASKDDVDSAQRNGVIGIVVGALGLIVGGLALLARRRATAA